MTKRIFARADERARMRAIRKTMTRRWSGATPARMGVKLARHARLICIVFA